MKTSYFPAALYAAIGAATTASAQTVTQIPLNYNFNGIVHAGEDLMPDAPDGYRSIADRGLNFSLGLPNDALTAPYSFVSSADVVDMVYLGNRNTVDSGLRTFDAVADGDDNGIQPNWLTSVDQTGPQTTTLATPIAIGGISSASFLIQISNGGGFLDCTIGFQSGATTTSSIGAPDWFGGAYAGVEATDQGVPGASLNISEVFVDLTAFDGDSVSSITFSNPDNSNAGYAILAGNINSGQTPVTITPVPLDFNFNGIVHAGEENLPDDPAGFRSISDRALDFTGGVPSDVISDPFVLQDQAGALDIVHLGNRNSVTNGAWAFQATANGDDIGTQPTWLLDVDQSVPQVTNLASPIPVGSNAEGKVLFQISDGGGSFSVFFSLQSGGTVVGTVDGPDWFGGTFPGRGATDAALPSFNLNLQVGTIDLSGAAGDSITAVSFSDSSNTAAGVAILALNIESVGLGSNYCDAVLNSSGQAGVMGALGSALVANNDITLTASSLPPNQFGIFAVAPFQGFVPGTGGTSNGNLCLSGSLGRYAGPGEILSSGASGEFQLAIDLQTIPQGGGTTGTSAGQTWNFQAWYRDGVGLGSNFTDGISITFQ